MDVYKYIKRRWNGVSFVTTSPIDGSKVLNLVSLGSGNTKTGNMIQTWHLPYGKDPIEARRGGSGDRGVCGDCPHRAKPGQKVGSCYVIGVAIRGVHDAYLRGRYPDLADVAEELNKSRIAVLANIGNGRQVRLGSYGDPTVMGSTMAQALTALASSWMGYTHQWRNEHSQWAKNLLMASADSVSDATRASRDGWRYFAVYPKDIAPKDALSQLRANGDKVAKCPASYEAGQRVTCSTCPMKCSGAISNRHNVAIQAHGAPSVMARYRENVAGNWQS